MNKQTAGRYITAQEIKAETGLSLPTVYSSFKIPGCPAIKAGRRFIVPRERYFDWFDGLGEKGIDLRGNNAR